MKQQNHRFVGILVSDKLYTGIPRGKIGHEAIEWYDLAGLQYNLKPCFFRLRDIDRSLQQVKAYIRGARGYQKEILPLPQVIHNRAFQKTAAARSKLQRLLADGRLVYNRHNRFPKQHIHDLLMLAPEFWPHLPCTHPATPGIVRHMMEQYDALIIKPNKGSIGRGIMKLERTGDRWRLLFPMRRAGKRVWRRIVFTGRLPLLLRRRILRRSYIVQQCLPLAEIDGRPFDMRVSVQRGDDGLWRVTGLVAKVAGKGKFVTNVAQGGKAARIESILKHFPALNGADVIAAVSDFSLRVATHLSEYLPDLADIGLDIGIDPCGKPLFIECNCKDQRYSFEKAGMTDTWIETYRNPIGYAHFLLANRTPQRPDGLPHGATS